MAYYAIINGGYVVGVVEADEDHEAIDKWEDGPDSHISAQEVRAATVREVLADVYGKDWATEDYRRNTISHLVDLYWNEEGYEARYPSQIVINHTCVRDIHGYEDPMDIANYRTLKDQWSEYEGLTDGPYSGSTHIGLELDKAAPADLIDVLDSLSDYPCLDDSAYSEAEQELIAEHWDDYGKREVLSAVAEAIGADELTDEAENVVYALVWHGVLDYGCGGGYPSMIDVSACDFGEKEVAAFISDHLDTVVTLDSHGSPESLDLHRSNLIAA